MFYLNSNYSAFQQKFNFSFPSYRYRLDASLQYQGTYGFYWSSSPYGSGHPERARFLDLQSSKVRVSNEGGYRATGISVRCFKDSYVAPAQEFDVTFEPNNGDSPTVVQVEDGETIDSGDIPSVTN